MEAINNNKGSEIYGNENKIFFSIIGNHEFD